MSKERARRRAEREAAEAIAREARARAVNRRARWRGLRSVLGRPVASLTRRRRPDSALRRQAARQNGLLALGLIVLNGVLWLTPSSWLMRGTAAVLSLLVWPLLVVLVFDRRRSA